MEDPTTMDDSGGSTTFRTGHLRRNTTLAVLGLSPLPDPNWLVA